MSDIARVFDREWANVSNESADIKKRRKSAKEMLRLMRVGMIVRGRGVPLNKILEIASGKDVIAKLKKELTDFVNAA